MGKKGTWFSAVKKALKSKLTSKDSSKKDQSKDGKDKSQDCARTRSLDLTTGGKNEKDELVIAAAIAAEAAIAAAEAAAEVARLTGGIIGPRRSSYYGPANQHSAALKIQTAFRGYLARRAFRALRGLIRLRALVSGHMVRRQVTRTLRCMQAWVRVQAQVRARRIHMSEEAAFRRQMWQRIKQQEPIFTNKTECDGSQDLLMWDGSTQSFEKMKENQLLKQEAVLKRERALAYAFTHQLWRSPSSGGVEHPPLYIDLLNNGDGEKPRWSWSWLERWMATRPSEYPRMFQHGKGYNTPNANIIDIAKSTTPHTPKNNNAMFHIQDDMVSTPRSFLSQLSMVNVQHAVESPQKTRSTKMPEHEVLCGVSPAKSSQRVFYLASGVGPRLHSFNMRSSLGGSSARDDESLLSSPLMPSYMAATQSARAKAKSPSNNRQVRDHIMREGYEQEGIKAVSAKKRLSFPALANTNTYT